MHGTLVAVALGATLLVSPIPSRSGPFQRLWGLIAGWRAPVVVSGAVQKEGLGMDPNGQCVAGQPATTESGLGMDPNGQCVATESGLGSDPNGIP